MWCYRQYSGETLARMTVVEYWRTKIRVSYWSIPPPLRISRVSEFYPEKGSKGEAASTDFSLLCIIKLDAYLVCRPCISKDAQNSTSFDTYVVTLGDRGRGVSNEKSTKN